MCFELVLRLASRVDKDKDENIFIYMVSRLD